MFSENFKYSLSGLSYLLITYVIRWRSEKLVLLKTITAGQKFCCKIEKAKHCYDIMQQYKSLYYESIRLSGKFKDQRQTTSSVFHLGSAIELKAKTSLLLLLCSGCRFILSYVSISLPEKKIYWEHNSANERSLAINSSLYTKLPNQAVNIKFFHLYLVLFQIINAQSPSLRQITPM